MTRTKWSSPAWRHLKCFVFCSVSHKLEEVHSSGGIFSQQSVVSSKWKCLPADFYGSLTGRFLPSKCLRVSFRKLLSLELQRGYCIPFGVIQYSNLSEWKRCTWKVPEGVERDFVLKERCWSFLSEALLAVFVLINNTFFFRRIYYKWSVPQLW